MRAREKGEVMSHTNGVVHSTEQEQPKSLIEEKIAAAAGEQRLSDASSLASAGAPESYQEKFFSVLHDIVSSAQVNIQKPSSWVFLTIPAKR
jgi:hypothetical protein